MPDTSYLDEIKQKYCRGLTEDEADYFEERAAILEEANIGMSRETAEKFAMIAVEARRDRLRYERERNK